MPVPAVEATTLTLGDVLCEVFPRLFEMSATEDGNLEIVKKRRTEVIIQGVEADLNTPMYWL
jgi:hypothetical protein